MSFMGQDVFGYNPVQTVDETADYTDMMGAESMANIEASNKARVKESPTKMLACLWALAMLLYLFVSRVFRRYTV